jgi:hypothetical protein
VAAAALLLLFERRVQHVQDFGQLSGDGLLVVRRLQVPEDLGGRRGARRQLRQFGLGDDLMDQFRP